MSASVWGRGGHAVCTNADRPENLNLNPVASHIMSRSLMQASYWIHLVQTGLEIHGEPGSSDSLSSMVGSCWRLHQADDAFQRLSPHTSLNKQDARDYESKQNGIPRYAQGGCSVWLLWQTQQTPDPGPRSQCFAILQQAGHCLTSSRLPKGAQVGRGKRCQASRGATRKQPGTGQSCLQLVPM